MPSRAFGMAAFAGAALGGAALGYLAERRTLGEAPVGEGHVLANPHRGRPVDVVAEDGTRLHAEISGVRGAPTMLFAHGVGLSQATWHYQREAFSGDYRIVAYDQRGHGQSDRAADGDYTIAALGRDLVAVAEACAPTGDLVLVGHSMGGMSVLAASEQAPALLERVRAVVLVNTAANLVIGGTLASSLSAVLSTVHARVSGGRLGRRRLDSANPEDRPPTDLSYLLTRQFGLSRDAPADIVAFVEDELRRTPPTVLGALAPHLSTVNLLEAAAALEVPTLLVSAARDRVTPGPLWRRLAEALPDVEVRTIEGAGHTAMLEAPEAVTDAMARFVARALEARAA